METFKKSYTRMIICFGSMLMGTMAFGGYTASNEEVVELPRYEVTGFPLIAEMWTRTVFDDVEIISNLDDKKTMEIAASLRRNIAILGEIWPPIQHSEGSIFFILLCGDGPTNYRIQLYLGQYSKIDGFVVLDKDNLGIGAVRLVGMDGMSSSNDMCAQYLAFQYIKYRLDAIIPKLPAWHRQAINIFSYMCFSKSDGFGNYILNEFPRYMETAYNRHDDHNTRKMPDTARILLYRISEYGHSNVDIPSILPFQSLFTDSRI